LTKPYITKGPVEKMGKFLFNFSEKFLVLDPSSKSLKIYKEDYIYSKEISKSFLEYNSNIKENETTVIDNEQYLL
jgi:hypothetical protein